MPAPSTRAYDPVAQPWVAALVVAVGLAASTLPVPDLVHHRLDSGLTLLVVPSRAAPVAAVQAWVGAGSADEAPGHAGIAHLVEHMLFKGTLRRGVGEIAGTVEAAGGDVNAWTSFDQTVYHAVVGSRDLDVALDVLADALVASTFDEVELAREQRVVAEEIRQGLDDPGRAAAQALFATAYVIHPYRRPVIGSMESMRALRRDDLVAFHRAAYVASNVTLVVAGDVDDGDVRRRVERHFAQLRTGPLRRARAIEPAQVAPRGVVVTHDISEAQLAIGFHAPPLRALDTAALDLAAVVLGQGGSSRLTTRLRDEQELVTGVIAQLHALRDPGLFVVSATTRPDRVDAAAEAIAAELARLGDDLSAAELDKARTAVEAAQLYQLETAEGLARKYGWHHANAGDVGFEREYLERVRNASVREVRDAVRRALRADNATVAPVLPPSRALATGAGRAVAARRLVGRVARARRVAERARTRRVAKAEARERDGDVVREVLPGGTRVLILRDPSVPIVAMRAVWPGGTRLETEATSGTTALLAATITRGCGDRDAAAVADEIDRLAGGMVGVGGRNSFGVRAEWLAKTWQEGLALFADCVLAPRLDDDEVERQRRALLDDLAARGDSGAHQAFRLFAETLYRSHPYRLDPLGSVASVSKLTGRTLRRFWKDHVGASTMTLAIVGDVDPDDVLAALRARLADVEVRKPVAVKVAAEVFADRPATEREVYRDLPREQAHLVIGFPRHHRDGAGSLRGRGAGGDPGRAGRAPVRRAARQARARVPGLGVRDRRRRSWLPGGPRLVQPRQARRGGRRDPRRARSAGRRRRRARRGRARGAHAHRRPRGRDAAPLGDGDRAGVPRGLRPGLEALGQLPRRARRGDRRRRRRGRRQLPALGSRGHRDRPAAGRHRRRGQARQGRAQEGAQGQAAADPAVDAAPRPPELVMAAARRAPAARLVVPTGRGDLVASLILIFPLYLGYAIGILFAPSVNGVDFVSRHIWALCGRDRDHYIALHAVIAAGFLLWVRRAHRDRCLSVDVVAPLVAESAVYAIAMGAIIRLTLDHILDPVLADVADVHLGATGGRVVASLGAGVHEELVFRLGGLAGGAWLLGRAGVAPRVAVVVATVASALLFAWAHHLGPYGDPWSRDLFAYRALAGVIFALIFYYRSLAHAVYAHVLYDLWVLVLRP